MRGTVGWCGMAGCKDVNCSTEEGWSGLERWRGKDEMSGRIRKDEI